MPPLRRLLSLLLFLLPLCACADDVALDEVGDLQQTAREAEAARLPVLLFFSATGCHYCHQVEEEFLKPMLRHGDYEGKKVLMRKLMVDGFDLIRDFNGEAIEPSLLQRRYRSYVTPTLVFVDGQGRPVAEKIVGINTPEMFGGYLDEAIDQALAAVRGGAAP